MQTKISSTSGGLSGGEWRRQGQPDWWMRKGTEGGEFVDLPRSVEGRNQFSVEVDLEPGVYQLGVGKRGDRTRHIREKIEVVPCATGCGRGTEKRLDRMEGSAEEQAALGVPKHSFCAACDHATLAGVVFGGHSDFATSAAALREIGTTWQQGYEAAQTPAAAGEWG